MIAIIIRGKIAARESAAIDHQDIPCEPVWLATITGSVFAYDDVKRAAKKYSFQVKTREIINAATIPGRAMGMIMVTNAPQIDNPSTRAASSNSVGIELNWSFIIQITIGKTVKVYRAISPILVSNRANSLYKTKNGNAKTTGGRISCDKKKNEMSEFRINPKRYLNRLKPYAVQLPKSTAKVEEPTAAINEL